MIPRPRLRAGPGSRHAASGASGRTSPASADRARTARSALLQLWYTSAAAAPTLRAGGLDVVAERRRGAVAGDSPSTLAQANGTIPSGGMAPFGARPPPRTHAPTRRARSPGLRLISVDGGGHRADMKELRNCFLVSADRRQPGICRANMVFVTVGACIAAEIVANPLHAVMSMKCAGGRQAGLVHGQGTTAIALCLCRTTIEPKSLSGDYQVEKRLPNLYRCPF